MFKKYLIFWFLTISAQPLRDPFAPCIRQAHVCKAIGKIAGTEKSFGLLAYKGKEQYVQTGDTVDGYEVLRITDNELVLKHGATHELKIVLLEKEKKKSPST